MSSILLVGPLAHAQGTQNSAESAHTIVQPKGTPRIEGNVRTEYAEVLKVEPVYLPAPQGESPARCIPLPPEPQQAANTPRNTRTREPSRSDSHSENIMFSLNSGSKRNTSTTPPPDTTECAPGQADEQVLYDVDYVLRGVKYRSRLPYDPGNRVRIQLSVTPVSPPEELPPPSPES